jgi:hypothetical protein
MGGAWLEVPVCAYQAYVWLFCKGYTGNIPNYCTKDYNMVQYPLQGPAIPTDMLQVWIKIGVSQTWNLLPTKTHTHIKKRARMSSHYFKAIWQKNMCVRWARDVESLSKKIEEQQFLLLHTPDHSISFPTYYLFGWLGWFLPALAERTCTPQWKIPVPSGRSLQWD